MSPYSSIHEKCEDFNSISQPLSFMGSKVPSSPAFDVFRHILYTIDSFEITAGLAFLGDKCDVEITSL